VATAEAIKPCATREIGEIAHWDAEADVVIVGFGCAGATAAIEAAGAGAEVLVLERAGGGGGTSALSGGILYLGGGTPVQEKCGFEDTPEEMFKYLMAACGPGPDEAKIRLFCDQGVPFKARYYPEPGMEPPTDDGLIYSGSEQSHPFYRIARPAPRGHKPQAEGAAGGFLMQRLIAASERAGVTVHPNTLCQTLVVDRDGRVVGTIATEAGEERAIRARRGVILSAGGFIKNREMVGRYAPPLLRCNVRLGCEGDDGRGIRMGVGAGGAAVRMEAASISIPLYPPKRLMRGILVNGRGQRFINEDAYYGRTGEVALHHQDGCVFLIVDDETYLRNHAGMEVSAVGETIEELEREIGLPDGSLQSTATLYNRHARVGRDPLFEKASDYLTPLEHPPFGSIDCSTEHAIYAAFTLGGLHTRSGGEVLDPDGDPVPGLYAAGRTTSGVSAQGYSSGISLADGTFFGREAGRSAARG
jgi:succinate dehydrogenase/fumarate reductase flavoprotein subunit